MHYIKEYSKQVAAFLVQADAQLLSWKWLKCNKPSDHYF